MYQRPGPANSLLLLASAAGFLLAIAAPVATVTANSAAPWLYAFFELVCHQRAERSFHFLGEPLAVCHRCFGLYLGLPVGLLAVPRLVRLRQWLETSPRSIGWFVLPLLIDVAIRNNSWASRFGTGLVATFGVAFLVAIALHQIRERRSRPAAARASGIESLHDHPPFTTQTTET